MSCARPARARNTSPLLPADWGARDSLLTGVSGGNADLYVGVEQPSNVDSYTSFDLQSTSVGVDVVRVDTTDRFYSGAGGTYYAAVYCAGPSGCQFTIEANAGNPFVTMTPSPVFGLPSSTPSGSPRPAPPDRQLRNTGTGTHTSSVLVLPPETATYVSVLRQPGYFGPMTVRCLRRAAPVKSAGECVAGPAATRS